MGGFSVVCTGKAWHTPLGPAVYAFAANPDDLQHQEFGNDQDLKLSNNPFEFICQVVTIWVNCIDGAIGEESSLLGLSDNSSATGKMYKSSFSSNKPNHQQVLAKLTELALDHNFTLHPEHIPGTSNTVAR